VGALTSAHIFGTLVPVEEPSTASRGLLGRPGTADEIAEAIVFLATDLAVQEKVTTLFKTGP
jgi:hypothetical protein